MIRFTIDLRDCFLQIMEERNNMKSWLSDRIVWIEIDGEFLADELVRESKQWFETRKDDYVGYMVDIRKMTKQSTIEQKKAEFEAKRQGTGKPRAVLGKDGIAGAIINRYTIFTGASRVRYFTDVESAKTWLHSQTE